MKEQIKKIVAMLEELLSTKPLFWGKVKLNFHKGKVVNVNIEESVTLKK